MLYKKSYCLTIKSIVNLNENKNLQKKLLCANMYIDEEIFIQ